ncbi:hypothetical protein LCGC14_1047970 [marine sediment metagenome]|uniref:Uncharacterized protein n=1 Tax=marine sediment metagenome TaxID=412755 RepID=A0A0F9Q7X9_9ZZZZ
MIMAKNFHGLHTPLRLGGLPSFTIPAVSKPVYAPGGIRILDLNIANPIYARNWIVSNDQLRGWRLALYVFKNKAKQIIATHYLATDEIAVDKLLAPDDQYIAGFQMTDLPVLADRTYHGCNFSQPAPVDVGGGVYIGVRLFPNDAADYTFAGCGLSNCEPPPGSTVEKCNTTIRRSRVPTGTDTVTIDGESVGLQHHANYIYGRWTPSGYEYKPIPDVIEVD